MYKDSFDVDFQVHLHEGNYGIDDVFGRMERANLRAIAVLSYPFKDSIPDVQLENAYRKSIREKSMRHDILCSNRLWKAVNKETRNELFLFIGKEIESADGWHLLDINDKVTYKFDDKKCLECYLDEGLSKNGLLILDHPFADPANSFADLGPNKEMQLHHISEKYGKNIGFEWNGYCRPAFRRITGRIYGGNYGDVNSKMDELAVKADLRVIPTSDTHARSRYLLGGIGASYTSFPATNMTFTDGEEITRSMKALLEQGNYSQHKGYVSFPHFFFAFGLPRIKEKFFGGDNSE